MSKIVFEKFQGNKTLNNWTTIFENEEDLISFFNKHKGHLLGEEFCGEFYSIRIRKVGEYNDKKDI